MDALTLNRNASRESYRPSDSLQNKPESISPSNNEPLEDAYRFGLWCSKQRKTPFAEMKRELEEVWNDLIGPGQPLSWNEVEPVIELAYKEGHSCNTLRQKA